MANRYPNTPVTGGLVQLLDQLRRSFPSTVTADTLKKLGIAPNNESYLLAVLRFIGLLDESGSKTQAASDVFSRHKADEFEAGLANLVKDAYDGLFELYGDAAWDLPRDDLIHYFRSADDSSEIVGKRQASTFEVLASKAGHRAESTPPSRAANRKPSKKKSESKQKTAQTPAKKTVSKKTGQEDKARTAPPRDFGLTVRVEVNLPAEGDQATYDRIFKSIRQYLIDG